jgi:alkylated DNA repair dioxygenase AlkB
LLPGLTALDNIVTPGEEAALIARIDAAPLAPFRFQGWEGKRLTASYGWTYDFNGGGLGEGEPMPDWLIPLRDRAAAWAGLDPDALPHVLLIRYDPGAGIGWHRDRPAFDQVIGVSLGAEAMMRFRRRREKGFDRFSLPLAPRSAYRLTGEARAEWEHSIAPMDANRWSITFRSLRR